MLKENGSGLLEQYSIVNTNWGYFRTQCICGRLVEIGLIPSTDILSSQAKIKEGLRSFLSLPLIKRLDILSPEEGELREVIDRGHLDVLFPSMARLYRIFGKMPKPETVAEELRGFGLVDQTVDDKQIYGWFLLANKLIGMIRPSVEEFAIHRWRINKRYDEKSERDEFINEATVVMLEGLIFNYDWSNSQNSPQRYIMKCVSDYLTGFSIWSKISTSNEVSLDNRDEDGLDFPEPSTLSLEDERELQMKISLSQAVFDSLYKSLTGDEQMMADVLIGDKKPNDLRKKIGLKTYEELRRRVIRRSAEKMGIQLEDNLSVPEIVTLPDADMEGFRKPVYSFKRPSFCVGQTSVFAGLPLPQVYLLIHHLPIEDQFLVLSYLGYYKFTKQKDLANALGFQSDSSLGKHKSIPILTYELAELKRRLIYNPETKVTILEIMSDVDNAFDTQILSGTKGRIEQKRVKRQLKRTGGLKSNNQQFLIGLDMNDPSNKAVYDHLTPNQQRIFDNIVLVDDEGDRVWSINSLALNFFQVDRTRLKNGIKIIAERFRCGRIFRKTSMREMANSLKDYPQFKKAYAELSQIRQLELGLYLGIDPTSNDVKEPLLPMSVIEIGKKTRRNYSTVFASISTSLSKVKKETS